MSIRKITTNAAAAAVIAGCSYGVFATDSKVPFPADYRKWAVAKSMVVGPASKMFEINGGLHHYYANEKAMEGYRSGKFPDGAVIVDERLQTQESEGITSEGPRRSIAVMMKDNQRYRETGGWGFEAFTGDNQTDGAPAKVRTACFECHVKQKDRDYVFTGFRK